MKDWVMLLLYFLTALGFWYIVGASRISLLWRKPLAKVGVVGLFFAELLECPACFGFWEGVAASYFYGASAFGSTPIGRAFIFGCITSASNLLLARGTGATSHE